MLDLQILVVSTMQIFAIFNPISVVPTLLSLTEGRDDRDVRRIVKVVSIAIFLVMLFSALGQGNTHEKGGKGSSPLPLDPPLTHGELLQSVPLYPLLQDLDSYPRFVRSHYRAPTREGPRRFHYILLIVAIASRYVVGEPHIG